MPGSQPALFLELSLWLPLLCPPNFNTFQNAALRLDSALSCQSTATFLGILTTALRPRPGSCGLDLSILPKRMPDAEESGDFPRVTELLKPGPKLSQTGSQSRVLCPRCQTQSGCHQPIFVTTLVRTLGEPASLPPPFQGPTLEVSPEV